ncbi:hypothetical protein NDU88_003247 [Pleurodeles waltl]|uniref:Uncharacterized protein n=1 Tax=Pleurodeles waltl TaxID=8319 RepID=A0AAV7LI15_PLEWA|nr:hypothetical protein NDU88_003247 [Pleurodeles waltl]
MLYNLALRRHGPFLQEEETGDAPVAAVDPDNSEDEEAEDEDEDNRTSVIRQESLRGGSPSAEGGELVACGSCGRAFWPLAAAEVEGWSMDWLVVGGSWCAVAYLMMVAMSASASATEIRVVVMACKSSLILSLVLPTVLLHIVKDLAHCVLGMLVGSQDLEECLLESRFPGPVLPLAQSSPPRVPYGLCLRPSNGMPTATDPRSLIILGSCIGGHTAD